MPTRRRIVPDASVLIPAYFPETIDYRGTRLDLSKRAQRLRAAIQQRNVLAIAPDHLIYEFLKTARRKISEGMETEDAARQVEEFLYLRSQTIRAQSMDELAGDAWQLCTERGIAPPDSWYLACAIRHDAELWVSNRHQDGFADSAKLVHAKVHVLTEELF